MLFHSMLDKLLVVSQEDLTSLADVMFLAWRNKFVYDEKSASYILKRDQLLEKIACIEESLGSCIEELDDDQFDYWLEARAKCIIQLFGPSYGAREYSLDYDKQQDSLSSIAEGLGWGCALEEVNKRYPRRLKLDKDYRGRHWKRASYFHIVKDYTEVLHRTLLNLAANKITSIDIPSFLQLKDFQFESDSSWFHSLCLVSYPPSDVDIFHEFKKVMGDRNHKYYKLFTAVNLEISLLLLGSIKALERSLSIGRKR